MRSSVLAILLSSSVALATPPGETPPSTSGTTSSTAPGATEPTTSAPGETPPQTTNVTPPGATPPAQSAPTLTSLDADKIPESCASLAKTADAPSINRALSARIALAGCLTDAGLKALVLCDCAQSVQEIETATELPRLLFDEAIALGDLTTQILARRAKGDLLTSLATRMLGTVPPPVNTTPEAIALRDTRMDLLTPLVQPWQLAARVEYEELDKTARANPQLVKNPAVAAAVRASRERLASTQGVANR